MRADCEGRREKHCTSTSVSCQLFLSCAIAAKIFVNKEEEWDSWILFHLSSLSFLGTKYSASDFRLS